MHATFVASAAASSAARLGSSTRRRGAAARLGASAWRLGFVTRRLSSTARRLGSARWRRSAAGAAPVRRGSAARRRSAAQLRGAATEGSSTILVTSPFRGTNPGCGRGRRERGGGRAEENPPTLHQGEATASRLTGDYRLLSTTTATAERLPQPDSVPQQQQGTPARTSAPYSISSISS